MPRKAIALLLSLLVLFSAAFAESSGETVPSRDAETEELLESFTLKHGSRQKKMVAFTVDDCYQERRQFITEDVAL